jgi:hypothetical protein
MAGLTLQNTELSGCPSDFSESLAASIVLSPSFYRIRIYRESNLSLGHQSQLEVNHVDTLGLGKCPGARVIIS